MAQGLDFQASDGAEMRDIAGEQGVIVFESGGGDEAVARGVAFNQGECPAADIFGGRQHANLEFILEIAGSLQLCR